MLFVVSSRVVKDCLASRGMVLLCLKAVSQKTFPETV